MSEEQIENSTLKKKDALTIPNIENHLQYSLYDRAHWWESVLVIIASFTIFAWLVRSLGVWEPWESQIVEILESMRTHQTWLQVNKPQGGDKVIYLQQLPFSYWPSLLTYSFWPNELGLRLAPIILASTVSIGIFHVSFKLWGRTIAYLSMLLWFTFPAVSLPAHFMIYDMGAWHWSGLACLMFLQVRGDINARFSIYGAWFLWVCACVTGGIIAGLLPLVIAIYPHTINQVQAHSVDESQNNIRSKSIYTHLLPMFIACAILILAIWRVHLKMPTSLSWTDLWVFPQPLETLSLKSYKGFQQSLHMLGFGLFPLSALIPMVLAYLFQHGNSKYSESTYHDLSPTDASHTQYDPLAQLQHSTSRLLCLWFALAFLLPALIAGQGGYMTAFIALPMAMGGGIYLARIPYMKPQNLWFFVSVLFLLLLDSNLSKNPQLLVETLLSHSIEDAQGWPVLWGKTRLLTVSLILFLLCYQSSFVSRILHISQQLWNRPKPARFNLYIILCGIVIALAVWIPQASPAIRDWSLTRTFLTLGLWGRVAIWLRLLIWVLLMAIAGMSLLWALWSYHFQRKQNLPARFSLSMILGFFSSLIFIIPHYLPNLPAWIFIRPLLNVLPFTSMISIALLHAILWFAFTTVIHMRAKSVSTHTFVDRLFEQIFTASQSILQPKVALVMCMLILLGFTGVQHHQMTQKFTRQLSQKSLIEKFNHLKQKDETLSLYQVQNIQHAYYLKDKTKLDRSTFEQVMQSKERQFVLIDRKRLSTINRQFRKLTKQNLRVLDNSGHRFLLISNQLKKNEKDLNPIKQALVKELPKGAHRLPEAINFEDKIEIIGWALDPSYPRPGATLDLKIYWRCKKRVYGAWKIFVHIDSQGQRIHADHDPVEGLFPTKDWNTGDLVQDIHRIKVKSTIKPADFIFYAGLYQGKKRMKVTNKSKKLKDKDNRAILGKIRVKSR